jgi:hypothetical protein
MKIKKFNESIEGAFQEMEFGEAAAFRRKYMPNMAENGGVTPFTDEQAEKVEDVFKSKVFFSKIIRCKEHRLEHNDTTLILRMEPRMSWDKRYELTINTLLEGWYFITFVEIVDDQGSKRQFYKCQGFDELISGLPILRKEITRW